MSYPEFPKQNILAAFLRFFVFSNFFIAGCAVLMVWQTCQLLLHTSADFDFIAFVFFATICSYSFHWYLTPDMVLDSSRLHWLKKNRIVHIVLFLTGLPGAAFYGIRMIQHWPWLLLAAFITFLYSAPKIPHPLFRLLRKVALGKTIFLAFVWMYVTTLLPLQVSHQAWRPEFWVFAGSRFFLIYAICILFDFRDREYDRSIGIRSLITWLNEKGIRALFIASLMVFVLFTLLLLQYGYAWPVVGLLLAPGWQLQSYIRQPLKSFPTCCIMASWMG